MEIGMTDREKAIIDRTYARDVVRKETWEEIVTRVVKGNTAKDPKCTQQEKDMLYDMIHDHIILPGGRHMWSVGAPGREFIDNCFVSGWSKGFVEHYRFLFMRLMEGGGVGSDYSNAVMDKRRIANISPMQCFIDDSHPDYAKCVDLISNNRLHALHIHGWQHVHAIKDSREGWARALELLLKCLVGAERDKYCFDFSHIRAEGKPLHGSGGTASGPAALMAMFIAIAQMSDEYANKVTDSVFCIRLSHEIAKAVMAGNTRRSAQIALKAWIDNDIDSFITAKQKHDLYTINMSVKGYGYFWESDTLHDIAGSVRVNGEPGIVNWDAVRVHCPDAFALNPCGELPLPEFGSCCLGSVNLAAALQKTNIDKAQVLLARFLVRGTLFRCQDPKTQSVRDQHRIIGAGVTGFADWMSMLNYRWDDAWISHCATHWRMAVATAADMYCQELGINKPRAYTTCAPTGTMSKVAGCSEGIQPHLYDYYINRVIYAQRHPDLEALQEAGYHVEPSANAAGSVVVSFPMRANVLKYVGEIETAANIGIENQLEMQSIMQEHYADNSISFTVNFDADKYSQDDIYALLKAYGPKLKGTTLMPFVGNGYKQLPQERITKEEYESQVARIGEHSHGTAGECKGGVCSARPFAD
jgi:ribonucleoside-triphosphate reductase